MDIGSSDAGLGYLSMIPPEHRLTVVIVGAMVLLVILFLFRSQLGSLISQLGGRIREIRLGKLAVTFEGELKEILEERKRNPGLALASPDLPQGGSKGADAAARDLVLESWCRLEQVVRNVEARMLQPSAFGKQLGEFVGLLVGLEMLSTDYAQQIRALYDLGQKVADSKGKLSMQDAHVYRELVDTLVEWIGRNFVWIGRNLVNAAPVKPVRPPMCIAPPKRYEELQDEDDDEVTCSVFSPRLAAPGDEILIQAYAHLPGQEQQVAAMAEDAGLAASLCGSQPLAEPVARGAKLGFHLRMRGVEIDKPDIVRVWRGEPLTAQFGVFFPEDFQPRIVNATVQVTKDSVPIGHIKFSLRVVTRAEKQRADADAAREKLGTLSRYGGAFISYASKDREEVLPMVQALAAAKINVFQDLINLGPGDRWAKELYKHIDNSDAFFLFWSKAAKESEWVMKEVLYAHGRQGGNEDAPPEIIPIIIEGPPPVKPPRELNFLHFNDKFIYLRKGVEVEASARDEAGRTDNP